MPPLSDTIPDFPEERWPSASGAAAPLPHFFICEPPRLLADWLAAFPDARFADPALCHDREFVLWLRCARPGEAQTLVRPLRGTYPGARLVVLADEPEESDALACIAAGAAGYCNSHAAPEVLLRVAQVIAQGGIWLGQPLLRRLLDGASRRLAERTVGGHTGPLSEGERRVAFLAARGDSVADIAGETGWPAPQVRRLVDEACRKLAAGDRLQLLARLNGIPESTASLS